MPANGICKAPAKGLRPSDRTGEGEDSMETDWHINDLAYLCFADWPLETLPRHNAKHRDQMARPHLSLRSAAVGLHHLQHLDDQLCASEGDSLKIK
jgi:hypothetical protein